MFVRIGLAAFTASALCAGVHAQIPAATAELSFANGISSYRSGEPIKLTITFRQNESDCYLVSDTVPSPADHIELTPASGVTRWQEGDGAGSDASGWGKLEPGIPASSRIVLNDLFRFDGVGDYTVKVHTRHLHCGQYPSAGATELVTNAVTFHVEPFASSDERQLAESLEQRIRSAQTQHLAEKFAEELDYLPGDDATQAKVNLTLHPKLFYPFGIDVTKGLWIARNRSLIVSSLQAAISDPTIYFGSNLIGTLVALQTESSSPRSTCCVVSSKVDPRKAGLAAEYTHQLARSMSARSGDNLVSTALTVFNSDVRVRSDQPVASADMHVAREVLITHFSEINEYQVGTLLQQYGAELADPRILPALEALTAQSNGIFSGNRSAALNEIHRITLGSGMQDYIAKEACRDLPVQIRDVSKLTDAETIPAVDACLSTRLNTLMRAPANAQSLIVMQGTMSYIARFADSGLMPVVLQAYESRNEKARWSQQARGAAICYLTRWNAPGAREFLDAVLPGGKEENGFVMFSVLESAMPSNALLKTTLRERIAATNNPSDSIVYDLSQVGTEEDRIFLAEALTRFHQSHQPPYSKENGRLETELVTVQIRGRSWDYSGEQAKAISARECRTPECKQMFHVD